MPRPKAPSDRRHLRPLIPIGDAAPYAPFRDAQQNDSRLTFKCVLTVFVIALGLIAQESTKLAPQQVALTDTIRVPN